MIEENRARYDLTIYRGEDYRKTSRWTIDKQPIDFTGYTMKAQIKRMLNTNAVVAEFQFDIDPLLGKFTFYLTHEQTAKIVPGKYKWDLKVTNTTEDVKYYICGDVKVIGRVTE